MAVVSLLYVRMWYGLMAVVSHAFFTCWWPWYHAHMAGGWWLLVVVVPKDSFHLLIDGRCTTPICVYVVWVDGRCITAFFTHLLVAVVSRP